jgi:hypothetical protein
MTPKKKNALMVVAAGFGLSMLAFALNATGAFSNPNVVGALGRAIVFGNVIFVVGCLLLARAKGHPWYVGLLGLLNLLGLAVLWYVVKDKPSAG